MPIAVLGASSLGNTLPLKTPPEVLINSVLDWQSITVTKEEKLGLIYKAPTLLSSLVMCQHGKLVGLQFETDVFAEDSDIPFYSFGIKGRTSIDSYILGLYGFLDMSFKEKADSLNNLLSFCNLNIGLEGMFKHSHINVNTYVPLRLYVDTNAKFSFLKNNNEQEDTKDRVLLKNDYLESGNFGADINLSQSFESQNFRVRASLGSYVFYSQPKQQSQTTLTEHAQWIVGGTFKLNWECIPLGGIYAKISLDNANRPLYATLGMQYQLSSHRSYHLLHRRLSEAPIERHLSPLFAPHRIAIREKEARHQSCLSECHKTFEGKGLAAIQEVFAIMEGRGVSIPNLIAEKEQEYTEKARRLPEAKDDMGKISRLMPRNLYLAFHSDKESLLEKCETQLTSKERREEFLLSWPRLLPLILEQNKKLTATWTV